MHRRGWDRVVTSDGHGQLLFYLVVSVTVVFVSIVFVRLLVALHLMVLPLR